jgi:hypothetical protein
LFLGRGFHLVNVDNGHRGEISFGLVFSTRFAQFLSPRRPLHFNEISLTRKSFTKTMQRMMICIGSSPDQASPEVVLTVTAAGQAGNTHIWLRQTGRPAAALGRRPDGFSASERANDERK